ncbi:extracellular solute-binding protein [Marinicrinis sediminis]|uniref:Extracellular solute-binding protein n=1 Tax=Marinicrinis sediminis TaxID=1652465 RepID=A0ABW5R9L2_9BACL
MKAIKKCTMGILAFVLMFSLAACGGNNNAGNAGGNGGSNSGGNDSGSSKDRVVIEYWHTYSDAEEKVLNDEIKPLFEEQNPGIELKLTRMPYEGLEQQVIAGVAGDAAPDLMRMDIVWVPKFADMGALTDVSKLDGFEEIKNNVFEGPMQTNFYNGGYYGVPVNTNTKVGIYSKALLEKAGLSEPPATMEELAAASGKLVEQGHLGGIGIGGAYSWGYLPYFWSLGGTMTNEDYSQVDGYLNSPESIKALEQIVEWNKQGLVSPTILGGEPGGWDGMKSDEYLMIDDGPWFYSILMNEEGDFKPLEDTVRGLIPAGDGGSRSVIGGEDLVIFANSKHPEEAWTFMKWMLSEEPQKIMSKTGLIPANKTAANDPAFLEIPFVAEYVEQLKTALPRTPIAKWGDMEGIVNLAFEKALRGEASAEDALQEATELVQSVLEN